MREDFLHYLWKYKKFDTSDLYTTNHEPVTIVHSGNYRQLAGPDFFNAQLIIGNQKWAGNVEIHLKSSDWYAHNHESDKAYENVILHVVWNHDVDIFRSDQSEIPVLELKHFVPMEAVESFKSLTSAKSWIFCERQLAQMDRFVVSNWLERVFIERLEQRTKTIGTIAESTNNDWEAVLFIMLAKNFGLNTNGEAFRQIALQIPFSVLRQESNDVRNLEALLFGYAHLLEAEKQDNYFHELNERFRTLTQKHQMGVGIPLQVEFFKHRPDNFPTIRLAQLAMLYSKQHHLFSKILATDQLSDYYEVFNVSVSEYWKEHFQFDKTSPSKSKSISKPFIDLLVMNTIVPIRFAFAAFQGNDVSETLISLLTHVRPESNNIIDKFAERKLVAANALESQSLLHLKNDYCNRGRCLECAIGVELLKQTERQNV